MKAHQLNHYLLLRFSSDTHTTLGALFRANTDDPVRKFICYTLEDRHREVKVPGETRIPAGVYEIKLQTAGRMAPKYAQKYPWHQHGMLCLQEVPNFTGIFIHPGENDKHTEGCILTGDWQRQNVTKAGLLKESMDAYKRLYLQMTAILNVGLRVTIEIQDFA